METMVPKLVAEDIPLLNSLLSDVFPGVAYVPAEMTRLKEELAKVCQEMYLVHSDGEEHGGQWVEKVRNSSSGFCLSCFSLSTLLYPKTVLKQKNFRTVLQAQC